LAKPTFTRLTSLVNGVTAINGVISEIESAFQNTFSRDGSSPNTLTATMDANSQRIINLPAPSSDNEPVRNGDYQAQLLSGSLVVPLTVGLGGTGSSTAAGARTSLGLGTAAVLDVGTTANKIVQLDGSAKLPAIDGSQLTNLPTATLSPTTGTLGSWVRSTSPTLTNVTYAAGTTGLAPYVMTAGTNLTSPVAGAWEYDGTVSYFTPNTSNRTLNLCENFVILSSTRSFLSNTSAQAIFAGGGGPTNGTLTLPAGTYTFTLYFAVSGLSASTHSLTFTYGGTATIGSVLTYDVWNSIASTTSSISIQSSSTSTSTIFYAIGVIRVTNGGTLIPSLTQTTNTAAATVAINSFFKITQVGSSSAAYVGNWS